MQAPEPGATPSAAGSRRRLVGAGPGTGAPLLSVPGRHATKSYSGGGEMQFLLMPMQRYIARAREVQLNATTTEYVQDQMEELQAYVQNLMATFRDAKRKSTPISRMAAEQQYNEREALGAQIQANFQATIIANFELTEGFQMEEDWANAHNLLPDPTRADPISLTPYYIDDIPGMTRKQMRILIAQNIYDDRQHYIRVHQRVEADALIQAYGPGGELRVPDEAEGQGVMNVD